MASRSACFYVLFFVDIVFFGREKGKHATCMALELVVFSELYAYEVMMDTRRGMLRT